MPNEPAGDQSRPFRPVSDQRKEFLAEQEVQLNRRHTHARSHHVLHFVVNFNVEFSGGQVPSGTAVLLLFCRRRLRRRRFNSCVSRAGRYVVADCRIRSGSAGPYAAVARRQRRHSAPVQPEQRFAGRSPVSAETSPDVADGRHLAGRAIRTPRPSPPAARSSQRHHDGRYESTKNVA